MATNRKFQLCVLKYWYLKNIYYKKQVEKYVRNMKNSSSEGSH